MDKVFDGNIGSFYSSNEFDRDTNPLILGQSADEVLFAGVVSTSRLDGSYGGKSYAVLQCACKSL